MSSAALREALDTPLQQVLVVPVCGDGLPRIGQRILCRDRLGMVGARAGLFLDRGVGPGGLAPSRLGAET